MIRLITRLAAVLLAALLPAAALAQAWPSKSVKIVVPFAAGGATDVVARLLAQKLSEEWGTGGGREPRRGGGQHWRRCGGQVGSRRLHPLMASGAMGVAGPHMYKSLPYDPARSRRHHQRGDWPASDRGDHELPARDLREFIVYAKANLNSSTTAAGTAPRLTGAENFAQLPASDRMFPEGRVCRDRSHGGRSSSSRRTYRGARVDSRRKDPGPAVTSRERNWLPDVPAASEAPGSGKSDGSGLAPTGTPGSHRKIYRDSKTVFRRNFAASSRSWA
jgi:hypothetical protein